MPLRYSLRSFALRVVFVATGLGLACAAREAQADVSDVSLLFVTKTKLYFQDSSANPLLRQIPFGFKAGATPSKANSIISGQFTPPGGTATILTNIGGGNLFFDGGTFATQAELDAAYPNSGRLFYNFALQTITGQATYNDSVAIASNFAVNVPKVQNGTWSSGGLQIDATRLYTLTSNDISPTTAPNQVKLEVFDTAG